MMFFHELSHVIFDENPALHAHCLTSIMAMLAEIGDMQKTGQIYRDDAPDVLRNSRELDPASPENIRSHYADELACDYQAFYLTCQEDSRGDGRKLDWRDALGLSVLSSQLLATLEGSLNVGTAFLRNVIVRASSHVLITSTLLNLKFG
jgi:hypothetical protein